MNRFSTLVLTLGLSGMAAIGVSAQQRQPIRVVMPTAQRAVGTQTPDTVFYSGSENGFDIGELLGIQNYGTLSGSDLLPITREEAEELITKLIVVSRAPAVEARRRAEIVNDFKVEQLKKRLLEQALRKTYADEYQHRLDRLENMLLLLLANGNKLDPAALQAFLNGGAPTTQPIVPQLVEDSKTVAMAPGATAPSWEHFLSQVFFDFDSSKLSNESKKTIEDVVGWLKENKNVELSLRGYASPEGNISYNNKLSARRVNAVADYLVSLGVAKNRLHIIPSGMDTMKEKKAVYPDARRVDIRPYYGE